jgi:hypothetical protein
MSAATDYLEEKIRKHICGVAPFAMPTALFVALHTADPTETGAVAEVTGGTYVRKDVTFADNGTSTSNNATVRWNSVGAVTVTHYSVWDAVTEGNCLWKNPVETPQTLTATQPLEIPGSALVFGAD